MPNASLALSAFQFCTRRQYFHDLCQRIDNATPNDRVSVAAMILDISDPLVSQLVSALESAALRGVRVYLAIDAYNFTFNPRTVVGPLWWHKELPRHSSGHMGQTRATIDRLRAAGVECTITNRPARRFTNPFAGRSHLKWAVVGDYQYVGGCNLENASEIDIMVGWRCASSSGWLFDLAQRLAATKDTRQAFGTGDITYLVDPRTSLLLDVGVKSQSTILDHALTLIDQAQEWLVLSCQYFPGGEIAEHLVRAHERGVKVRLLLNNISKQQHVNKIIQRVVTPIEKRKVPKEFFDTIVDRRLPYLHAKILASEQEAMVGSHNYVPAGVKFGTAELTLYRKDTSFAKQLVQQVLDQTNFTSDSGGQFDFLRSH